MYDIRAIVYLAHLVIANEVTNRSNYTGILQSYKPGSTKSCESDCAEDYTRCSSGCNSEGKLATQ